MPHTVSDLADTQISYVNLICYWLVRNEKWATFKQVLDSSSTRNPKGFFYFHFLEYNSILMLFGLLPKEFLRYRLHSIVQSSLACHVHGYDITALTKMTKMTILLFTVTGGDIQIFRMQEVGFKNKGDQEGHSYAWRRRHSHCTKSAMESTPGRFHRIPIVISHITLPETARSWFPFYVLMYSTRQHY